jgi:arylsulfatase A-like enzyme
MGMGMDILPTMLSFAGVPIPAGVDGTDLSSSLVSGEKPKERTVFWEYANQRAVRRGDWKLIQNPREFLNGAPRNETWLSNLKDDAKESRNWSGENISMAAELQKAAFPF